MKTKIFTFYLLFLICSMALTSQTQVSETVSPFVNRIRVGTKDKAIVLLWEDPVGLKGTCVVLRYIEPITQDNYKKATILTEVPFGTQVYSDEPKETGVYYYGIFIKDTQGRQYEIFIPLKNMTASGISLQNEETSANSVQETKKQNSLITSINSTVKNDYIELTFLASDKEQTYIIYRSTQIITEWRNLLESYAIATVKITDLPYKDYPVPGIDYFYAVIEEASLKSESATIKSGDNSTLIAAQLPLGQFQIGLPSSNQSLSSRSMPLPTLSISANILSGREISATGIILPTKKQLGSDTLKAIDKLLKSTTPYIPKIPEITILENEKDGTDAGENFTLREIILNNFAKKQYNETINLLGNFLSVYRSANTKARAHFYLGQCYALTGRYKEAFLQFLLAENGGIALVSVWETYLLGMLHNEK